MTNASVARYLQIRGVAQQRGDRGLERECNFALTRAIQRYCAQEIRTTTDLNTQLARLGFLAPETPADDEPARPRRGRPPRELAVVDGFENTAA